MKNSSFSYVRWIFVCFMCYVFILNAQAQKIEVKSFDEAQEIPWIPQQRKDENGVICALVRVAVLPDEHILFKGNVIGQVDYEGNEYRVYLSSGTRYLRVHYPGYETLFIDFQSYGYEGLVSKRIYELVLSFPEAGLSNFTQEEYEKLIASAKAEEAKANYIGAITQYEECLSALQEKEAIHYVRKVQENINYCKRLMALKKLKAEKWESLSEGLCLFKVKEKYGFVDSVGNVIVHPLYESACEYRDGVAWVKKDGLWGSLNQAGEMVVSYQYKYMRTYWPETYEQNRCLEVTKEDMKYSSGVIDYKTGEEILPCKYRSRCYGTDDGEYLCYVDDKDRPVFINKKTGKEQFKLAKDVKLESYIGHGYCVVYKKKGKYIHKYGVVDKYGNEVLPCEYAHINTFRVPFGEEASWKEASWMVVVHRFGDPLNEHTQRLYNLKQRTYVGGSYVQIFNCTSKACHTRSLVVVYNKVSRSYYGVLNYVTGKEVISPTYRIRDIELPESNENPIIAKCYQTELYYLYDMEGNRYDAPQSEEELNYQHGYTRVKRNGKFGYANAKGELVLDCIFDEAYSFRLYKDILAATVWIGEDKFYITPSGERIENEVIEEIEEKEFKMWYNNRMKG